MDFVDEAERGGNPHMIKISTVFVIGLILTLYLSFFQYGDGTPCLTVNGGTVRRFYNGLPIAYIWEDVENVPIQNKTLYLRNTRFIPMLLLLDWLIFTTISFIAINSYDWIVKRKRGDIVA